MYAMRRSCREAFQNSHAVFSIASGSQRAFSRSAIHYRGTLPVYLEPSSPELSALLSTLNSKVLLPAHLTPEQQKLVYKPENRAKLESEPIEITLGDVTLPLEHIDRIKDIPRHNKTLRQILAASKTPEDWENVLRMLQGFEDAGLRLKPRQHAMVLRNMNSAGMYHLILKAVQRPAATGVRLRGRAVALWVMRSARDRAMRAQWEKEELKKASSMADQVVELMEHPEHRPLRGRADLRSNPPVVAVPLELAAELAHRHGGDTKKVKTYAVRLMNALKQHNFTDTSIEAVRKHSVMRESDFGHVIRQAAALTDLSLTMASVVPLWNGLSTARTVLGADMPMAAEAECVQRQVRDVLRQGEECLDLLSTRAGNKIITGTISYPDYVRHALKDCEDSTKQ